MAGNNPKLDLVNVDVHTKFGRILSMRSQDIERKRNSDVNQSRANSNSVKILLSKILIGNEILVNNPKLDPKLSMLMCIQNLVGFCQCVLKILSGNEILTLIKGHNSVKILRKMAGNNPKLDLVNVDVYTKFSQILSICS